jgi:hypothetical protein
VPVAIEHYQTSIIPWVSRGGKKGRAWLKQRSRPANDPLLMMVAPDLYQLWKGHAVGAGGPFPVEILKKAPRLRPAENLVSGDQNWRAMVVLGGLLFVTLLFIGMVLLTSSH